MKTRSKMEAQGQPSLKKRKIDHSTSLARSGWTYEIKDFSYKRVPGIDREDLIRISHVDLLGKDSFGVFAVQEIPANTWLGRCVGDIVAKEDIDLSKITSAYYMAHTNRANEVIHYINTEHAGNFTRFINHGEHQANTEFTPASKDHTELYSIKKIMPGEQLLANYNISPDNAAHFYFLNVDDSSLSSLEYHEAYKDHYSVKEIRMDYPALGLAKGDFLYVTSIGTAILENQSVVIPRKNETLNLRQMKALRKSDDETSFTPEAFNQFDTFNAFMLACYLGQKENISTLLSRLSCDVNRQQNLSGRSALFLAVEGYKAFPDQVENYLEVISILIESPRINLFIQDNRDRIFLHFVVEYCSAEHAKIIFDKVLGRKINKENITIKMLTEYLDKDSNDLFLFAIQKNRPDTLEVLLTLYPDYLINSIGEDQYYSPTYMQVILAQHEHEPFKTIFLKWEMPQENIDIVFSPITQPLAQPVEDTLSEVDSSSHSEEIVIQEIVEVESEPEVEIMPQVAAKQPIDRISNLLEIVPESPQATSMTDDANNLSSSEDELDGSEQKEDGISSAQEPFASQSEVPPSVALHPASVLRTATKPPSVIIIPAPPQSRELAALQRENEMLSSRCVIWRKACEDKEQAYRQLTANYEQRYQVLQQNYQTLQQNYQTLQQNHQTLQQNHQKAQRDIHGLQQANEALLQNNQVLQQSSQGNQTLQQQNTSYFHIVDRLSKENDQLHQEKAKLEKEKKQLKVRVKQLEAESSKLEGGEYREPPSSIRTQNALIPSVGVVPGTMFNTQLGAPETPIPSSNTRGMPSLRNRQDGSTP